MVGGNDHNNASGSDAANKPHMEVNLGKQPAAALPDQSLPSTKNVYDKRIAELLNAVQVVGPDFHSDTTAKVSHVINLFQSYVENGHPLEELARNVVPAGKIVHEYLVMQKGTPLSAARAALESYLLPPLVTSKITPKVTLIDQDDQDGMGSATERLMAAPADPPGDAFAAMLHECLSSPEGRARLESFIKGPPNPASLPAPPAFTMSASTPPLPSYSSPPRPLPLSPRDFITANQPIFWRNLPADRYQRAALALQPWPLVAAVCPCELTTLRASPLATVNDIADALKATADDTPTWPRTRGTVYADLGSHYGFQAAQSYAQDANAERAIEAGNAAVYRLVQSATRAVPSLMTDHVDSMRNAITTSVPTLLLDLLGAIDTAFAPRDVACYIDWAQAHVAPKDTAWSYFQTLADLAAKWGYPLAELVQRFRTEMLLRAGDDNVNPNDRQLAAQVANVVMTTAKTCDTTSALKAALSNNVTFLIPMDSTPVVPSAPPLPLSLTTESNRGSDLPSGFSRNKDGSLYRSKPAYDQRILVPAAKKAGLKVTADLPPVAASRNCDWCTILGKKFVPYEAGHRLAADEVFPHGQWKCSNTSQIVDMICKKCPEIKAADILVEVTNPAQIFAAAQAGRP